MRHDWRPGTSSGEEVRGGALNANLHVHAVLPDGVFVEAAVAGTARPGTAAGEEAAAKNNRSAGLRSSASGEPADPRLRDRCGQIGHDAPDLEVIAGHASFDARIQVCHQCRARGRMLSHSILEPGAHGIRWDGRDQSGADLPSGVYLIRILAGGDTTTGSLVMLR